MAANVISICNSSSPSEDYEENILQPSDDSYQPGFSKSSHHPSISTFIANPTVEFTLQGNHNLQTWDGL
jgi:hypothetical protein